MTEPQLLFAQLSIGNETTVWTFVFVTITFMIYLAVGWWSRVAESEGFYVAGRGVPAIANGAATAADWMSAASFMGLAGLVSYQGHDGSVYLLGWTGGYVLLALLLAPYLRKFGHFTVPDFFGARYYGETPRVAAAICAIFISLTYVAGQMRGVGIVFSRFLQVPIWEGVLVGMVIVAFFAVLGGMKGITWTQVIQYFVLIAAFLIPVVAIAHQLTGNPLPQLAMSTGDVAARLDEVHQQLGFAEYTQPFAQRGWLDSLCVMFALMVGTAGLPHVIVRFYTVPDVRSARWSAFWALLFIAALYTAAPALAMFSRYVLLERLHGAEVQTVTLAFDNGMEGPNAKTEATFRWSDAQERAAATELFAKYESDQAANRKDRAYGAERGLRLPPEVRFERHYVLHDQDGQRLRWVETWQQTGLIQLADRDADGRIDLSAASEDAGLGDFREAQIDPDTLVLAAPEVAGLSPWIIALVATGALAAALSTAAGLLLVISSSFAHDLWLHFVDREAPESRRVLIGRCFILVAILAAAYFGIHPPDYVASTVAFAFGLAAASFFPAILLGVFDTRTNREGAVAGMLVGIGFTTAYILAAKSDQILGTPRPWFGASVPAWLTLISPEGIGAVGCCLNFFVTFGVSRITAPPPEEVQALVEQIRLPGRAEAPEAHFEESDAAAENP